MQDHSGKPIATSSSQGNHSSGQLGRIRYIPLKFALMATFLALIIVMLLGLSWFNYSDSKQDMENAHHLLRRQTENNILKIIKIISAGNNLLKTDVAQLYRQAESKFLDVYKEVGEDLSSLDFPKLSEVFQGKLDFSLVDAQGLVAYGDKSATPIYSGANRATLHETFFAKGHLDDFSLVEYNRHFEDGGVAKIRFFLLPDKRYLLRVRLSEDVFAGAMQYFDLFSTVQQLKTLNPSLERVQVFTAQGDIVGTSAQITNAAEKNIIQAVLQQADPKEQWLLGQKRYIRYVPANLTDVPGAKEQWVVKLTYTTWMVDYALEKKAGIHFIISIVAVCLSIAFTFLLSAWITRPVKSMVEGVNIIAQGDLEYPLANIKTANEFHVLKQSILLMVANMRHLINQAKKQNQELKKLDKLKDDFLSNTSHELRTPLNGIIGIADSMLSGAAGPLDKKVAENIQMIVLSGRRLSNLVNDILDFSKLKHQNISLQIKPLDIRIVVDIVLALSSPLVIGKPVELINAVTEKLPPVDADENRLQQILYNLIGNAIKFTDKGKVEVTAEIRGSRLHVSVEDTGIGIAQDKLETIFNSFEQADSSMERIYGGTGLGLSISKQLVELHGGNIQVQSKCGKGTKMTFSLPVSQGIPEPDPKLDALLYSTKEIRQTVNDTLEHVQLEKDKENQQEVLHILIVDDEPVNLQVLENLLLLENYATTRAQDGEQALQAVNSGIPFAVILLDIMMPKMSGFEVCKIIRQTYSASELPIIMLTAKNRISDLVNGLQVGANDYLSKPFAKDELTARLKTHIRLAHTTRSYSRFVPHEFLNLLQKESILDVQLGDHVQKNMTVMFVDIRSFTWLSEKMTPRQNFDFINAYLYHISPVIRRYNGFIDKYIGDAIMALFPGKAEDAVNAVVEVFRELRQFNQQRKANAQEEVRIGAGIHSGYLMLGTIGESKRMEGTVISDVVNLAARLEGLNKLYDSYAVISEQTLLALEEPEKCRRRFLGKVRVKGKRRAVKIFELLEATLAPKSMQQKTDSMPDFQAGLDFYYKKQFDKASEKFRSVLRQHSDEPSRLYLERCLKYAQQPPLGVWDGVEELTQK